MGTANATGDADSSNRLCLRHPAGVLSESCDAMSVVYFAEIEGTWKDEVRDEIRILIPGEQGAFEVAHQKAPASTRWLRGLNMAVVPANQQYAVTCQRRSDLIVIRLSASFFQEKAREALGCGAPHCVERRAIVDPFLRAVGDALRNEFRSKRIPSREYLQPLAGVIAFHLARNYCAQDAGQHIDSGLPLHKLRRVQAFIEAHIGEGIRIEQLAATVHMSLFHFARMFKRATGHSPHLYVTVQRIERAKELLSDTSLPLMEVAARVGFQTQGHFTYLFHRYTGITPRAYRLSCRSVSSARVHGVQREWTSAGMGG
jgi:AraC family transcriptional regulator